MLHGKETILNYCSLIEKKSLTKFKTGVLEVLKIFIPSFYIYDSLAICPRASAETGKTVNLSLSPAAADRNYRSSSQWLRFVLCQFLALSHRQIHIYTHCMGCCRVLAWNTVLQPLSRIAEQVQTELSQDYPSASQEGKDHRGLVVYLYNGQG